MGKSAQRQFLVKVHGIPGYFMTKSGGQISADTNKVYDGGELRPEVMAGPAEAANVTVTRGYDYERDHEIIKTLKRQVGEVEMDITITPTRRDMSAYTDGTNYPAALLVGLTEPDVDASSGDPGIFELEFAIADFT